MAESNQGSLQIEVAKQFTLWFRQGQERRDAAVRAEAAAAPTPKKRPVKTK